MIWYHHAQLSYTTSRRDRPTGTTDFSNDPTIDDKEPNSCCPSQSVDKIPSLPA